MLKCMAFLFLIWAAYFFSTRFSIRAIVNMVSNDILQYCPTHQTFVAKTKTLMKFVYNLFHSFLIGD